MRNNNNQQTAESSTPYPYAAFTNFIDAVSLKTLGDWTPALRPDDMAAIAAEHRSPDLFDDLTDEEAAGIFDFSDLD